MAIKLSYCIMKRIGQMEIFCTCLLIIESLNFFSQKKKINFVLIWLKNVKRPSRVWVSCKLTPILSILYYYYYFEKTICIIEP